MAARNAVKLCEELIVVCTNHSNGLRKMTKDWSPDGLKGTAICIADTVENISHIIQRIKSEIEPKCIHPKKMQDIVNGKRYCMNCNFDLDD